MRRGMLISTLHTNWLRMINDVYTDRQHCLCSSICGQNWKWSNVWNTSANTYTHTHTYIQKPKGEEIKLFFFFLFFPAFLIAIYFVVFICLSAPHISSLCVDCISFFFFFPFICSFCASVQKSQMNWKQQQKTSSSTKVFFFFVGNGNNWYHQLHFVLHM